MAEELKKKGGIWAGKRGLYAGCEHNQSARDEVLLALQGQMNGLLALLRETETAIDRAGAVLAISQPARISGKYGVRWWRVKPGLPYHEPVIVRWMPQKNGVMTPRRAKMLKANSKGNFAINEKETQECLEILSGLIKRRTEIKGRIFSISKSLRSLDGISYRLNNEAERIEALNARVVSNLLSNGYEVESRFLAQDDHEQIA